MRRVQSTIKRARHNVVKGASVVLPALACPGALLKWMPMNAQRSDNADLVAFTTAFFKEAAPEDIAALPAPAQASIARFLGRPQ